MIYPDQFDELQGAGMGIAGTPETVRKYIAATAEQTGITYFVSDMAFGSIPYADAARSVELFAKEVMPAFR
jgi:alkanesulfonate monooxygenase SsuD/methylene tetrahydromethanopterin reductase-like flavin-dependent oxidoreductase (luciferase family)